MFEIGQYVICGNKGACVIEDIATLDISGVDKGKKYYVLKPLYVSASTVYVSVDAPLSMRKILTGQEALQLIKKIPEISGIEIQNERLAEKDYKECLKAGNSEMLVKLIKTIYLRKQKRLEAGRKETAVDSKYFKIAEDMLYGELAVALQIERKEVLKYITEQLQTLCVN